MLGAAGRERSPYLRARAVSRGRLGRRVRRPSWLAPSGPLGGSRRRHGHLVGVFRFRLLGAPEHRERLHRPGRGRQRGHHARRGERRRGLGDGGCKGRDPGARARRVEDLPHRLVHHPSGGHIARSDGGPEGVREVGQKAGAVVVGAPRRVVARGLRIVGGSREPLRSAVRRGASCSRILRVREALGAVDDSGRFRDDPLGSPWICMVPRWWRFAIFLGIFAFQAASQAEGRGFEPRFPL